MKLRLKLQWKLVFLFLLNLIITVTFINFVTKYAINEHFRQFCQLSESGVPKCIQSQSGQQFLSSINTSLLQVSAFGSILALLLGFIFSRSFLKPFKSIIASAKQASSGNYQTRISTKTYDETDQLIEALNDMYASLQKVETLRIELVANMSHELSTPLTNIYGYLEALSDNVINKKSDKDAALKLIKEETERLIQLIAELKKLAILESENVQLSRTHTNINSLIEVVCAAFSNKLQSKSIDMKLNFDSNLPKVSIDKHKIQQVISNLLDNAIKYSPSDSAITIRTYNAGANQLMVKISDQGIGISNKDLPYIFERFFQADKSRSRKTGIGIGLTIVQKIVTAHGGRILAESKPNKGTSFTVILPLDDGLTSS